MLRGAVRAARVEDHEHCQQREGVGGDVPVEQQRGHDVADGEREDQRW